MHRCLYGYYVCLIDEEIDGAVMITLSESAMKQIGLNMKRICHISRLIRAVLPCYRVNATYVDAKRVKGIRAAVYKNAEIHLAYYSLSG